MRFSFNRRRVLPRATLTLMGAFLAHTLSWGAPLPRPAEKPAVEHSAMDASLFYQVLLAEVALTLKDPGASYSLYLEAAKRLPDPELYERAVAVALQARAPKPALQAADAWLQAFPSDTKAHWQRLGLFIATQQLDSLPAALQAWWQATPSADQAGWLTDVPALLSSQFGEQISAAQLLNAMQNTLTLASRQAPLAATAWLVQGALFQANQQVADADQAYQTALSHLPQSPESTRPQLTQKLWTQWAKLAVAQRRAPEAMARFDQARAIAPQDTDLAYEHALSAERLGEHAISEALLRQVIGQNPDHADALNALGYSLADRNQALDEAESLVRRALALQPNNAYILDSLGWIQFRRGQLDEAMQTLETAHTQDADPEIGAHLGEVYWVNQQVDKARAVWQQALDKAPTNATLLQTLKRLGVTLP